MEEKEKRQYIIHAMAALMLGGILYILFCPDVWFVKKIDDILKIEHHIYIDAHSPFFLRWIRNYLFDMLWAYALVFFLYVILGTCHVYKSFVLALVLGILMEIAQLEPLKICAGTFDMVDLAVELLAGFIAMFHINQISKNNSLARIV